MSLYGKENKEAWQTFSDEVQASYINNGFMKSDRVELKFNTWKIVLDTYSENGGNALAYTRIRSSIVNPDSFKFKIYRKGILSNVFKLFGTQNIPIGDTIFDNTFIVKSNSVSRIKVLLSNTRIKDLLIGFPYVELSIKGEEGAWGQETQKGTGELRLIYPYGIIKDINVLKNLFELFKETLTTLLSLNIITDKEKKDTI